MGRVISAELFKLKKNKAFWLIAIVMAAAMAAMTIGFPADGDFDSYLTSFGDMLPFFSIIVIVSLAQNDDNYGTLKNTVSSGASRFQIYFGKLIVTFIAVLILFVIDGVVSAIGASMVVPVQVDVMVILKGILFQLIVALNYTIVFYLIASVITKGSFAIVISYIIFMLDGLIFGTIGSYLHMTDLTNYTMSVISNAISNGAMSGGTIFHLAVLTGVIIVGAIVGALVFSKKDIK